MSTLSDQLQSLHSHGFSNDEADVYESDKIVKDIEQTCSKRLSKNDLGLFCSLLFDTEHGLLPVLTKNISNTQHKAVREDILSFLSIFIPRIGSSASQYSNYIQKCCVTVYRSDRYAKNKVKALHILMEIISKRSSSGSADEQQIISFVKIIFEEIAVSKCTSTVKGQSLLMLGVLARHYPEYMTTYSERLFDIYLGGLKKEMITSKKDPDLKLIEGYLLGLHSLLFSFTSGYDEDIERCKTIFKFARMSLHPETDLSRYAVPLAGMKVLKDHSAQFGPLLVNNYESYYKVLNEWFEHKNHQLRHEAHAALDSFLQQVACTISAEEAVSTNSKELFSFFIRKFQTMLSSTDLNSKMMSIAVRGYGLFAAPCRKFLKNSDVQYMLLEIMGRCEQMFLSGNQEIDDNKIHQLPSFIQSLASITQQIEISKSDERTGLSESFMFSMCRLCVLLMEKYPKLHRKFHVYCYTCLFAAIQAFEGKPEVRKVFLQRIIYQGLIRSCSYGVIVGEDRNKPQGIEIPVVQSPDQEDVMNDSRTITYKDYIPLWRSLMAKHERNRGIDYFNQSFYIENRNETHEVFCSIFLDSIIKVVSKLNLGTTAIKDDSDLATVIPGSYSNLNADNAVDFKIFVNLVDLCWDLLPSVMQLKSPAAKAFSTHFYTVLQELISLSTRFPTVSGFYKLLATVVKISDNLHYFALTSEEGAQVDSFVPDSMEWTEDDKTAKDYLGEIDQCLALLQKFILEVVCRLQQFKDDLLASCLFFLLNLPGQIASGILPQLSPVIQRSAVFGLGYYPLAEALLGALERWKSHYMKNRPELELAITALQPFLLSDHAEGVTIQEKIKLKKNSKASIRKQKNIKDAEEPARKKIRLRVVEFLGSLGGGVLSFLRSQPDSERVVALWDKDIVIKYAVPFRDLKPEIRLDSILPRVLEIATQSSDRKAKVSACELLHSVVLFTIGTNAQTMNIKTLTEMIPALYKKVLPVLLKLACEVDQVCKQMFEPLVKQIIHWFTNNRQFESPSTVTLLNVLMDGLVDKEDTALRELSAQSISEFLAWSIKQNTGATSSSSSPSNAKSIFKRLYSFALHPASNKRLGASVAFNHLYRTFRENEKLVSDYVLEILVVYIESLASAHDDDVSIGTQASCLQTLQHLERIIKAKAILLNVPSDIRRIPKAFDPSKPLTLSAVVNYLFEQGGRPQTGYMWRVIFSLDLFLQAKTDMGRKFPAFTYDCYEGDILPRDTFALSVLWYQIETGLRNRTQDWIIWLKSDFVESTKNTCDYPSLTCACAVACPKTVNQKECRHRCMHLFYELVTLLPDSKLSSASLWIRNRLEERGPQYFVTKFETGNGGDGIHKHHLLSSFGAKITDKVACKWFDLVIAALEAFSWVFQGKLLSPAVLLNADMQKESFLFRSVRHFVCDIANLSIEEVSRKYGKTGSKDIVFTPQDVQRYNVVKCSLISRILQFFVMIFQNFPKEAIEVIPSDFWEKDSFFPLVCSATISPSPLGFDTLNDRNVKKNLSGLCCKLLSLLNRNLNKEFSSLLLQLLGKSLFKYGTLVNSLPTPFNNEGINASETLHDLLHSYVTLNKSGILGEIFQHSEKDIETSAFCEEVFLCVFNSVVSPTDSELSAPASVSPRDAQIGSELLDIAFEIGISSSILIQSIYDKRELRTSSHISEQSVTQGGYFMSIYNEKICLELCRRPGEYLPLLVERATANLDTCLNVLTTLLDFLATNRNERKTYSAALCDVLLKTWNRLTVFWHPDSALKTEKTQSNVLDLLRKLFVLDVKVCTEPNHPAFEPVFEMFSHMLTSTDLKLSFKLQALDLLSCFTIDPSRSDRVKPALECLAANHFPFDSREFAPGSSSCNHFMSAMRKILNALEMSGNLAIFQTVLTLYCREEDHVLSDDIQSAFRECVKSMPPANQKSALEVPYAMFATSQSATARRHAINDVLVPMATQCDVVSLVQFFSVHASEIMDVVKEETRMHPENQWADQLERKVLAYRMLELMFSLLPKEQTDASSTISQAYSSKSPGKESLMKGFMTRANRDRNEPMQGATQLLEERRRFHCAVYNALIAAVICTQTDQKWYKAFLFDENPSKNQFLLDNVIDTRSKYTFEVEISEPLKKRKRFVAIRRNPSNQEEGQGTEVVMPYMASIAGSSLSEEVSAFDANRGRTLQSSQQSEDSAETGTSPASSTGHPTFMHQGKFIELESNNLNQHECMAPLVALITHMHHNNIGLPTETDPAATDLPAWMVSIHRKLSSNSTHSNVRIFLAKLIVNCEEVFRPYAKHWLAPMAQTILREDCGASGIDWMVCDVVATLLSWNAVAVPEDNPEGRGLAQGLVEHLAERFDSSNRPLLRHNLQLIKAALECWGSRIKSGINPGIVHRLCASTDKELKLNFGGLQLLGALLANGISPYLPSYVVERRAFFESVFRNIPFKRKEIYDSASEVAGMVLKHLTLVEKESEGEIHDMVASKIKELSRDPKRQDIFITCLHKVATHHPPIVDQFLQRVIYLMPKVHGDLITCCYEIIYQRADAISDLNTQLKPTKLPSKLSIGNEALQLVCLRLCRVMVDRSKDDGSALPDADALCLVTQISLHFPQHSSVICRQEAAVVMMETYDRQMRLETKDQSNEIISCCKLFLLKMLNDPEEVLRNQVSNFWSEGGRLPVQACAKLAGLLSKLYDPHLDEAAFMANTVGLLLQSASLSPDFERPLFDHPLADCVFQEYKIDNRWQHRHSSMTPLFVDTLQAGNSPTSMSPTKQQPNQVMATQDNLQFSATVDAGKNTYNWMTGNSLDTFSSLAPFAQQPERRSALLSVSAAPSSARYRAPLSDPKPGADFGQRNLVYTGPRDFGQVKGPPGIDVDVERLRRRFRKESDDSRIRFAREQERRDKFRERVTKDQVKQRESEVQLHRKYRSGELPDVQIPHRSIVAPLAAACLHDPPLSRLVLSSLVLSLLQEERKIEGKTKKSKADSEDNVQSVVTGLASILERSSEKNPALMGCIEDVCYHSDDGSLSPSLLASTSLSANKHALGIVLIEQMILNKDSGEPVSKRRKTSGSGFESDPEIWLQLARLYKSIGDFDVLCGVFGEGTGSNPATAQGLTLESNGSFREAKRVYEKALAENTSGTSDVEKDLWEDCLLNCIKQMSRWDHVNKMCDSLLDRSQDDDDIADDVTSQTLSSAWGQHDFQERFLGSAVHAKLLLHLQGQPEVGNQLSNFFDDAMKGDDGRKTFVERNFSEQLAMLYIHKNDYDRAKYYLQVVAEQATQRWSTVGALARSREQEIFRVLPVISDLRDFLNFAQKSDDDATEHDVRLIIKGWMTKMPHVTQDPVTSWHDIVSYRTFLMDKMKTRLERLTFLDDSMDAESGGGDGGGSVGSWIDKCKSRMLIEMMRSAYQGGNFAVASKIINHLEKDYETSDAEIRVDLAHATTEYYHARARHLEVFGARQGATSSAQFYAAAFRSLQDVAESKTVDFPHVRHQLLFATTYEMTSQSLEQIGDDEETRDEIRNMVQTSEVLSVGLEWSLRDSAYLLYEKAVKLGENSDADLRQEAFNKLASFCDRQIRDMPENTPMRVRYAVTMTTCLLRSLCIQGGGRSVATLRFPRLLQMAEEFGDSISGPFVQESKSVPTWTFLGWIGHMVALLDRTTAPFVHSIMTHLSKDYPQAVIYPLCAAQEGFDFEKTEAGKKNKSFVKKLLSSLHNEMPIARDFIGQLQLICDPVTVFKDWKSDFCKLWNDKAQKKATTSQLLTSYQNMYKELFEHANSDVTKQGSSSSLYGSVASQTPLAVGQLRTKFAKAFKAEVDALFGGSSGSTLLQMRDFRKKVDALAGKMKNKFTEKAKSLQDYSPWLAGYQGIQRGDSELEIPGQYHGKSRPLVEYHVTIVAFDERVCVMNSLRRPCRVIIRGSDEQDHVFLVKGGEDLRQDQRIEQIFDSVNDVFQDNASCRERDFSIVTYQVIPINSKVGLIAWVPNVKPFFDVMKQQAERMGCMSVVDELSKLSWVPQQITIASRGNRVDEYGKFMQNCSYADVVDRFHRTQNRLPWNMLREVYLRMSADPEAFVLLRKRFVSSYSCMCVVHWLLGIGDRHPSNFMISTTSGRAVGIDFGHAFGSAIEILPVPELVPFRLTRQLTSLLRPHAVKRGEFRQFMVHCLSALRSRSDEIVPLLDVFIKDPSVDWQTYAKKSRHMEGTGAQTGEETKIWYAKRKIKIVQQKLRGGNPAHIICDEIKHNANLTRFHNHYCSVAKGDAGHGNVRAHLGDDNLSVEQQVDCLIDQATDPNVLGRTYQGWRSWL